MEKYEKFINMVLEMGANDARIIKTDTIVGSLGPLEMQVWMQWVWKQPLLSTELAHTQRDQGTRRQL